MDMLVNKGPYISPSRDGNDTNSVRLSYNEVQCDIRKMPCPGKANSHPLILTLGVHPLSDSPILNTYIKIHYPLVNIQKTIENGPVEIVDLPMNNGDLP